MHVKLRIEILKTPKKQETRQREDICCFTFDTFENQLGPLQAPGYGHLLQTDQKTEGGVWDVENMCGQTKYNLRQYVCGKARVIYRLVSQVGRASVEREHNTRTLKHPCAQPEALFNDQTAKILLNKKTEHQSRFIWKVKKKKSRRGLHK